MSKNTQLASLINYISVDGSGNVILSSGQIIATQNYVATAVSNLVASAPSTLDTLNELATALGNNPNFATTVTNSIATKLPLSGGTLTGLLTAPSVTLQNYLTFTSIYGGYIMGYTGTAEVPLYYAASSHNWSTAGDNRMRLTTTGLGIGTMSPGDILDVQKNQNATTNIYFRNTDNTNSSSRMYLNLVAGNASAGLAVLAGGSGVGDLYIGGVSGGNTYFQNSLGGGVTMTLTSGNNVGIGTTNAIDRLTVSGRLNLLGLNQNSLWFNQNAGGSSTGFIVGRSFASGDGQDFFIYDVSASAFRLNILGNGNVGFGTTNPQHKIHVNGGNIYSTDTVFARNLKPEAWAGPAAGSPTGATIPQGYSTINISSPCDNNWRVLLTNINDTKAFMWVTLGDAASKDTASYTFQMTSPAYGVANFAQISYMDGGWNTGGFEFTYDGGGNGTFRLLVRCSSYYNGGNTAYGTIYFLRLE